MPMTNWCKLTRAGTVPTGQCCSDSALATSRFLAAWLKLIVLQCKVFLAWHLIYVCVCVFVCTRRRPLHGEEHSWREDLFALSLYSSAEGCCRQTSNRDRCRAADRFRSVSLLASHQLPEDKQRWAQCTGLPRQYATAQTQPQHTENNHKNKIASCEHDEWRTGVPILYSAEPSSEKRIGKAAHVGDKFQSNRFRCTKNKAINYQHIWALCVCLFALFTESS